MIMELKKALKLKGREKYTIGICIAGLIIFELILLGAFGGQPKSLQESMQVATIENPYKAVAITMAGVAENPIISEGTVDEPANQVQIGNEKNTIFVAQNYEYAQMFGNPQFWDDEKNMSVDVNGDGACEDFTISRHSKEGILLEGGTKQNQTYRSMNFWICNVYGLLRNTSMQAQTIKAKNFLTWDISGLLSLLKGGSYIVEGNYIVDDDFEQISCCDIDEDGIKEVLVSVGNRQNENITAIYEYSEGGETPFTYCGYISCDTVVRYIGSNIIWAYRGNLADNLHDTYIYEDEKVRKLTGTNDHE